MKKITVIVDMQNDFISGSLGTAEAQGIFPKVRDFLANIDEDTYVIFTRDTHDTDYLNTPEGQKLPVEHCIRNTWGWEIPQELTAPFCNRPVTVDKPTFGSTVLMDYIADLAEDEDEVEIAFCGLCTDICVVSNVLMAKAHFPNCTIVVYEDMCAGVTPATHKMALETMKMCQIDIR